MHRTSLHDKTFEELVNPPKIVNMKLGSSLMLKIVSIQILRENREKKIPRRSIYPFMLRQIIALASNLGERSTLAW
jgi:hypothetical protein